MVKKPITILITNEQYRRLNNKKNQTGNSQGSIIREALEQYLEGDVNE